MCCSNLFLHHCQNILQIHVLSALYIIFIIICFLGPHPWHMEVPRPRVQSELYPPAYTTATAMRDLSHICDPHHSSWPCQILNPLSEARERTHNLMDTRWMHLHCPTMGTPHVSTFDPKKGNTTLLALFEGGGVAQSLGNS